MTAGPSDASTSTCSLSTRIGLAWRRTSRMVRTASTTCVSSNADATTHSVSRIVPSRSNQNDGIMCVIADTGLDGAGAISENTPVVTVAVGAIGVRISGATSGHMAPIVMASAQGARDGRRKARRARSAANDASAHRAVKTTAPNIHWAIMRRDRHRDRHRDRRPCDRLFCDSLH